MPDLNVTIVLPSGGARTAEVPDDVAIKELMPEFTSLLELPTVGPDGRAMTYRLDSKALGRELKEEETLSAAGVPENDRLMLTADITAGAGPAEEEVQEKGFGDVIHVVAQGYFGAAQLLRHREESLAPAPAAPETAKGFALLYKASDG